MRVGLGDLVRIIDELSIRSIAVPPLGCGLGGLDWNQVRPMIVSALDPIASLDAHLYGPGTAPRPAVDFVLPIATKRPKMTLVRAVVVELVRRYSELSGEGVTRLEIHLLAYFAQVAGVPLKLSFEQTQHGPSAENLNRVLKAIDRHFLCESTDEVGTSVIRVHDSAFDDVASFLAQYPEVCTQIDRVIKLVDGFESPYALELLSKLHFAAVQGAPLDQINEVARSWSESKDRLFTDHHVEVATAHLKALVWMHVQRDEFPKRLNNFERSVSARQI